MDSGVTSVHSKGRDAEVVVQGSVLKVSEAINKLEDALGRGNHESKSMGVGTCTAFGGGGTSALLGKSVTLSVPQFPHLLSGRK